MSSDTKGERRPKVVVFFTREPVHFAPPLGVKTSLEAKHVAGIERTPGGLLVRYEAMDRATQKRERRETFIPDANIASMDLEASP